jgi:hypothetical protein
MRFFRNPFYNKLGMVRKRPAASVWSHLNVGAGPPRRPFYPGSADCPEAGKTISFEKCLSCPKHAVWHPSDGDLKRCWHEFKSLESRGYYDGTWNDHPENFDPETFAEIQERKRLNEEVRRQMEQEKPELERMARKLEEKSCGDQNDDFYWLNDDYEEGEEDEDDESAQAYEDEDEDER